MVKKTANVNAGGENGKGKRRKTMSKVNAGGTTAKVNTGGKKGKDKCQRGKWQRYMPEDNGKGKCRRGKRLQGTKKTDIHPL